MANHAFQLRRATIKDFPDYYQLHLESLYHWLMFDYEEVKNELQTEPEDDEYFGFDVNQFYLNFDESQFAQELEWYRIYMVVIDQKSVGYVKLESYNGKQIVREWPMNFEYRDTELLTEILAKIEKLKTSHCRAIQVIAMADSSAKFLFNHGYQLRIRPFFEKSLI